jgi:eukaryotic-like serine/threonine-protein kinase
MAELHERTVAEDADEAPGPPEADPRLGTVLAGLYRLEERIGEGGMGTVYRATHVHLGKGFAIKVLSPQVQQSATAVERLRQEAVTASSIDHDHIVNVLSFDRTDDGDVFIVMELLRGRSLHDLLAGGPLPLTRAVPIAQQVARALGAAHALGIVHRDLKPENVFIVDKDGADFVKVLDFGISKVRSAESERVRVTRTGQLIGTPLYMSPEQARGETEVDLRADVYALGIILYEMLTGSPPFDGRNYFQLLWKHGNETPEPPSRRTPDAAIPTAVEVQILRALQKDPAARFDSMAAFEEALAKAAPTHALAPGRVSGPAPLHAQAPLPAAEPSAGRPARRWIPTGVAAVVVLGAALALWVRDPAATDTDTATDTGSVADAVTVTDTDTVTVTGTDTETATDTEAPADTDTATPTATDPLTTAIRLESHPPGARVYLGDQALGTTPTVSPLPADGSRVRLRFTLRGYRDAWIDVEPREGSAVRAHLVPRARATPAPGRPLPMKTEL